MGAPLLEPSLLSELNLVTRRLIFREVSLVAVVAAVAVVVTQPGLELVLSDREASAALAVAAGALALATAAMWFVVHRLTQDIRAALSASAIGLYGLVALPVTTLASEGGPRAVMSLVRLAAHVVVVVFFLTATSRSAVRWRTGTRTLLSRGLLVILAAGAFALVAPGPALAVSEASEVRLLVAAAWLVAGIRLVRLAAERGVAPSVRAGVGLSLLALAHGYRIVSEPATPGGFANLTFASLRLVALIFIGVGALRLGARALNSLHSAQYQPSVVANTTPQAERPERSTPATPDGFAVAPVLAAAVSQKQAAGLNVEYEVATWIRVAGSAEAFSQVLAHLLDNCAQHAPRSSVSVLAWAYRDRVIVRISDRGPGVSELVAATMFELGGRGPMSEGGGLGLYLCRQLVEGQGGSIHLHRAGAGCTVQLELPLVAGAPAACGTDFRPGAASGANASGRWPHEVEAQSRGKSRDGDVQTRWVSRLARVAGRSRSSLIAVPHRPRTSGNEFRGARQLGWAVGFVVVISAAGYVQRFGDVIGTPAVEVSLALASVAAGVIAAFSCSILGQLADEAASLWLGAGLTLYSLIGIPMAIFVPDSADSAAAVGNVRTLAHLMFVTLALAAVFVASRPRKDGWVVLGVGGALSTLAIALGIVFPAASSAVTTNSGVRYAICAAWLGSGFALLAAGWSRRLSWLHSAGIGCTVIASAHLLRVTVGSSSESVGPIFSMLLLYGVLVIASASLQAARSALAEAHSTGLRQLVELHRAQSDMREAAEHRHEIRTGLASLANATAVLSSGAGQPDERAALQSAMAAEVKRLSRLVQSTGHSAMSDRPVDYDVVPVLEGRLAMIGGADTDVRVDLVEPQLRAIGNPSVLSQVLANVLANCRRHAPGSPIRIQARRREGKVVVRVRDFGPGVPAELAERVFELGVRGPFSIGEGLGLGICRRLLDDESGAIFLKPHRSGGAGCTVIIELPASDASGSIAAEIASAGSA